MGRIKTIVVLAVLWLSVAMLITIWTGALIVIIHFVIKFW